jgi:predicted nucleotidyltransferase
MPVRSLNSFVLVWPTRAEVDDAVREWVARTAAQKPDVRRIGYFGSYARGDWGVGSDLDLVAIVDASSERRDRRALAWDTTSLPVPADLLIYTEAEWQALRASQSRFARTLANDVTWVFSRPAAATC